MKRTLVAIAVGAASVVGLSAPAWADTGGQSFVLFGQDDEPATVVASGPISGVGEDFESATAEVGTFVFPEGSITAVHPTTSDESTFNEVACFGTDRFEGTYTLVGGTGDLAGASGSGTYRGRAFFIGRRTAEGCSDEGATSFFLVRASGTTTVP
jgi:hypothetical protein